MAKSGEEIVPLQCFWDLLVTLYIWKCDEGPGTGGGWSNSNDTVVATLCVVERPICTVQYEPVLWGQCWVKMELCRSHIPSVFPGNGRNCACTGENSCEMKK